MRISSSNDNNYILQNKKAEIAYGNNQNIPQTKQSNAFESQKTEILMKVSTDISAIGKEKAREAKNKSEEMQNLYQEAMRQLENAKAQAESVGDAMKIRMKCLQIAMNIIGGDKVPSEDYSYLAENDMELYSKAIMMRLQKKDPKERGRISEDEESAGDNGEGESADIEVRHSEVSEIAETSSDSPVASETT